MFTKYNSFQTVLFMYTVFPQYNVLRKSCSQLEKCRLCVVVGQLHPKTKDIEKKKNSLGRYFVSLFLI